MHRYLLHNDEIRPAGHLLLTPGQVGLLAGWGVFSTLRVAEGVLFTWERHFARMERDARLMRVPFPDSADWLEERLLRLVDANGAGEATLRVAVVRNLGGMWQGPGLHRPFDVVAFTTDLKDWGESVKLAVEPQSRHAGSRFAGTKVLSWSMNLTYYEEAQERGFEEVILLNEHGEVSECTSANIFAIEGTQVWTPPLSSGCLPGITRALLLDEIRVPGIQVSERTLEMKGLSAADEVFITSTTRELLPVSAVEGFPVKRGGEVRGRLHAAFRSYAAEYLSRKRAQPLQV